MKTTSSLIPILVLSLLLCFQQTTLTAQCTGNQRVDPTFSLLNNDICEGGVVTVENFTNVFGHSNVVYVWDWGDGSVDTVFNQANVTHVYNFPDDDACTAPGGFRSVALTLDVIVPGCERFNNFSSTAVFVIFNPVAEFAPSQSFVCLPDLGTSFNNATCTADTSAIYTWNFGDPASGAANTSNEFEPEHVFSGEGVYNVTLEVQTSCGISTSSTQQVEVKQAPVANAALFDSDRPDTLCAPFDISLTNQSTSGESFEWVITPATGFSFTGGTNVSSSNPQIQIEEAGDYRVTLITTNECKADTLATPITFSASKSPTVDILPVDPACDELTYQPTVNLNGNADNVSWTIEGDGSFSSNQLVPNDIVLPPGNYTATLEVSNICGTGSDVDNTIQVFERPRVILRPVDPVCRTGSPFEINFSTNDTTGFWSGSGVTPEGEFDPNASGVVIGTNTLTYTVGVAACQVVRTLDIIVRDAIALDIGRDTALCAETGSFFLTGTPMGGTWTGPGILDSLSGEFDPNTAGAGRHEINYAFFDAGNDCLAQTNKDIEVQALPEINFEADTLFLCASGDSYRIEDNIELDLEAANGRGVWTGQGITDSLRGVFQTNDDFLGTVNVFYTYRTSLGCQSSQRLSVTLTELINVSAQRDVAACVTDSTTRLLVTPDFGTWSTATGTNPIEENTGVVTINDGGSSAYVYTLFPGTSCQSTDTVRLEVINMSEMTNAGDNFAICDDAREEITLRGATPLGGQWRGAGVTNAVRGTVDTRTFTEEQNVVYYEVESAVVRGCIGTDSIVITVDTVPTASFNILDSVICSENIIQFENQSSGATTYNWDFGSGAPSAEENPTFTFSGGGIQDITLTAFSPNAACTDLFTQQIDITESPSEAMFDISARVACVGTSTNFIDQSSGEDLEYFWDFGNGETSTLPQPRAVMYEQGLEDTIYLPSLTITNICGTNTLIDTVRVLPNPTAFFGTLLDEYCEGEAVKIQNSSFGTPETYFWTYGNGRTSMDSLPISPVYSVDEEIIEFPISLTVTNGCGEDSLMQTIRIRPSDVRAFFNIDSTDLCVGDSLYLESFSTADAIVNWQFGDGNNTNLRNPIYAYDAPGVYTLSHVAFGCGFDSIGLQVEVRQRPEASFTFDEGLCLGDTIFFTNTSNAPSSTWNFGDGTELNLESPAYSYNNTGNYSVRLTASDGNCADIFEEIISVSEPPRFELELPDTLCTGSPGELRVLVNQGYSRYSWDFGDNSTGVGRLARHTFIDNGKFDIIAEVENSEGCIVRKTGEIIVLPTPEADFVVDAFSLCTPSEVDFLNTTLNADSFEWRFDQGDVRFITDVSYRYEEEGDFQVQLIAGFQSTCFDTMSQVLPIRSTPNIEFELQNISCGGDNDGFVRLLDTLADFTYALSGPSYFQTNPSLFTELGAGSYMLTAAADNGCDTTYFFELTQPQELEVNIREDSIAIVRGDAVPVNVSVNNDSLSLSWVNLDKSSINEVDSSNFVLSPLESGLYVLEATDGRCVTSDSVYFDVLSREQVYLANAFSPNGDERNNYFYVQAGPGIANVESFQIFDRKGELIYEAQNILPNNPLEGWDGSFNGQMMNQGVFVYAVQVQFKDGTRETLIGDVLLVR
ncbi:MAG: PKD domain-containing protein [Bacteroidota bacterium]